MQKHCCGMKGTVISVLVKKLPASALEGDSPAFKRNSWAYIGP